MILFAYFEFPTKLKVDKYVYKCACVYKYV